MEKIQLTQEKLLEILGKSDDAETMEYYYNAVLKDEIEANQYGALLALLLMLVRHYNDKLFVGKTIDPSAFFGLNALSIGTEYWKYKELLDKTNFIILMSKIHNENIPNKPLEEFSEIYSHAIFSFGEYLGFLGICENALRINPNNALCNFLKSSIVELCYINKTPIEYKIALLNYKKSLLETYNPEELPFDIKAHNFIFNECDSALSAFGADVSKVNFTPVLETFEKTKEIVPEWTEEHDFCLRNKLLLNPLCNFGNFIECSYEDFEELPISNKAKMLFDEIIYDYKLCRGIAFSYYKSKNGVGKREMCMVYSYAYSIFDKLAYLFKIAFDLKMNEQQIGFTEEQLFNANINGTQLKFKDIKNNNILPLYLIMKKVREKQRITNALQVGTFEHNELRNTINHKSVFYVKDAKLKRNSSMLLQLARNAIIYSYMLLHSCPKGSYEEHTAVKTAFFDFLLSDN